MIAPWHQQRLLSTWNGPSIWPTSHSLCFSWRRTETQQKVAQATETIARHQNELRLATWKLSELKSISTNAAPKMNKPRSSFGKDLWWAGQHKWETSNEAQKRQKLLILLWATSPAPLTNERTCMKRPQMKSYSQHRVLWERCIKNFFKHWTSQKTAPDKLAKWKQLKDVSSFNDDILWIILDISNTSHEEQIDQYSSALKPYIWKKLWTKDYKSLLELVGNAERLESAQRRGLVSKSSSQQLSAPFVDSRGPVPMEIGSTELRKPAKEERERCMKKIFCLRCREKGHLAKIRPESRRNWMYLLSQFPVVLFFQTQFKNFDTTILLYQPQNYFLLLSCHLHLKSPVKVCQLLRVRMLDKNRKFYLMTEPK